MTVVTRAARIAGVVCLLEALVLMGIIGFYVYEIVQGESDDAVRAVMSVVLMLVFALGLGAMGRAWWQGLEWQRTPTVVWNALLLPVAVGLYQADQTPIALAVGLLALTAIAATGAERNSRSGDVSDEAP